MSPSDLTSSSFADLAGELSSRLHEAVERDELERVPNEEIGQLFASVITVFAAKAQAGIAIKPFGRNSRMTATDVAIGCTAMLDAVGLALFEFGAWQAMSTVGRQPRAEQTEEHV